MFDIKWIRDNAETFDNGLKRRGLAEVPAEVDDDHVGGLVVQLLENRDASVRRAVVHEDDLPGPVRLVEDTGELVEERLHASLLVVHRDDDRDHEARVQGAGRAGLRTAVALRAWPS